MLRLLADENLDYDLVRGALRLRPTLNFVRVQDVGLSGASDPDILACAAREARIVLTHDVKTMIRFASERISSGLAMAGLFIVHQERAALSRLIDDLLLLDEYSDTEEWINQIPICHSASLSSTRGDVGIALKPLLQDEDIGSSIYVLRLVTATSDETNRPGGR